MKIIITTWALASMLFVTAHHTETSYEMTDDYSIRFSAAMMAKGNFHHLNGVVDFSEDQLEKSSVDVSIDAASIHTGNKLKDKHANNSKWLSSKEYPTINFRSESVIRRGDRYQMAGTLTLKGISLKQEIDFDTEMIDGKMYLVGSTVINRKNYNLEGHAFAPFVSRKVTVDLRIPANFNS